MAESNFKFGHGFAQICTDKKILLIFTNTREKYIRGIRVP